MHTLARNSEKATQEVFNGSAIDTLLEFKCDNEGVWGLGITECFEDSV